jgi:hypothetical protein
MKRPDGYVDPRRAPARAAVLAALPGTRPAIAAATGLPTYTVARAVAQLHREGKVHVGRWRHRDGGGVPMPVYVPGPGADAPENLKRLTRQQIWARYEKRVKGTEVDDRRKAQRSGLYWQRKAAAAPNGWAAALFAPPPQRRAIHA